MVGHNGEVRATQDKVSALVESIKQQQVILPQLGRTSFLHHARICLSVGGGKSMWTIWGTSQDAEELLRQAVIFPVDTQTLSGGNIEISQEIQTE